MEFGRATGGAADIATLGQLRLATGKLEIDERATVLVMRQRWILGGEISGLVLANGLAAAHSW